MPHSFVRRSGSRFVLPGPVLAAVVAGLLPGSAPGQEGENMQKRLPIVLPSEAGYAVRHWTVADGLPGQRITSLAQTPDGYLWCGTDDGLVRYDGSRFRTFFANEIPELEGFGVGELSCDRDGRLWIWGGKSELVVLEAGRFRKIGAEDGWTDAGIRPIATSQSGRFWFVGGAEEEFYRFGEDRFERFPHLSLPDFLDAGKEFRVRLHQVWVDETGPRWAMIDRRPRNADGMTWSHDRRLIGITPEGCGEVEIEGRGSQFEAEVFFTLPDGTAGLGSRDGIYAVRDGRWSLHHRFDQPVLTSHGLPQAIRQDARGNYWIATQSGGLLLSEADGTTRQFVLPEEERRPTIRALCIDRSGNLWAGSRDGLYKIARMAVRSWGRSEGVPEDEVRAVAEGSDGQIWLAGEESVVPVLPDGALGSPLFVPRDDLVQRVVIERLAASADGSLWVALRIFRIETQGWRHELWKVQGGRFVFATNLSLPVTSLHEPRDGIVLAGTGSGLFGWDGKKLRLIDLPGLRKDEGELPHVTAFAEDGEGRVVATVLTAGLFRRENGTWIRLMVPAEGDRQGRNPRSLSIDREGTVWVGCGRNGLACWIDGSWKSFAGMAGILPREITGVAADDMGGVWLTSTTGEGLVRLDAGELIRWLGDRTTDPTATHLSREDGLPSIVAQSSYSPVCRDREGRIWIATKLGAAVLHPASWKLRREAGHPPQVHIQEVRLNDVLVSEFISGEPAGNALRGIVVPPGPRRVELRYIGIDLAAPEDVRYRYRLDGYEAGWTEAGERTVAVYPDLPPGRYVFRVAAAGRFGLWNKEGAGATVTVQPLWWERTLTRIAAVLVLIGLLSLAYVYRLSQIKAKTRMQEEFSRALIWSQESERKRLAKDLHDGLGHELLVLKGGIDRELSKQEEAQNETARALSAKAGEVIHRVREISHDLRPPELERFGIGPALESLAHATAELTGIELAIDLDPPEQRLRPVVEISLFRIAQEALSNMARHSDASEGRIALSHTESSITLVIEDDGRGFEPASVGRTRGSTGLGLSGMEERTHLIGGIWQCKTEPGEGVWIEVVLPLLYRT